MNPDDKENSVTDQMFGAVGRAITQWSFVEQTLSNIFIICVTPCPYRPSTDDFDTGMISMIDSSVPTAIFYSVESFRGKLGLVDAALNARIYERGEWATKTRGEWSNIREKVRKLSLKRNRIAHWTVTPAMQDEDRFIDAKLMPPYGSPGWWRETGAFPPGNSLSTSQVEHLALAFHLVNEKLRCFYKELGQHSKLSDKYDKLTVRQIHLHDRLYPTRGEQIRRDLASRE